MALKIAIVPVMLLSILWRNRRERRRRAEAAAEERAARVSAVRRDVVELSSLNIEQLRVALDRANDGACLVSSRNEPLTSAMLRQELAAALMDAGLLDEAAHLIGDVPDGSPALMLSSARLHALSGEEATARKLMSAAAEQKLEEMRAASRGLRTHLAEMLAETLCASRPPVSPRDRWLSEAGPLELLSLSGRTDTAVTLAAELASVLGKALEEGSEDPTVRIDGLPLAAIRQAHKALLGFCASNSESDARSA